VTYLNTSGQMGGAETSLLQLLSSVKAAQPDWKLNLVLGEDGPFAKKVQALGIPTQVLTYPPELASLGDSNSSHTVTKLGKLLRAGRQTRAYTRELTDIISELRPDLIHSTGFKMHLLGLWARSSGVAVIWHIHDYVGSRPVMRRLLRWQSPKCSAIIVNSKSVLSDVLKACSPSVDVVAIYNSVDLQRFSPTGRMIDLDAAAGVPPAPPGTVKVGLLGTFAKWKGHRVFLKAISLLPANLPVRAYIIGAPIYQTQGSQFSLDELRQEAIGMGLEDRVAFTGFIDEPEAAMRSLDVVVHASTQPEPFGMVIVEAMACGKAVIASSSSGAAEIFSDGKDVLSYPCGDAEELAKGLRAFIDNPELRIRLGSAGRRSVERVLHGSRLAAELESTYRRVTASKQTA
jgi:glycosyltransferase involved in cell wall biosynthesis